MPLQRVADPTRWRGLVVICANTAWSENPLAAKNLAVALQAHTPVLYVDPPISRLTVRNRPDLAESLVGPRLRLATPRIARLTPVVLPGKDRPGMSAVTDRLTARAISRAVQVLGGDARAIIDIAPNHHVYDALPNARHVFWVHDDYTADPELTGIDPTLLLDGEDRHTREADLVVTVSPTLQRKWRRRHRRVALVPNGCDHHLFTGGDGARAEEVPATVMQPAVVVSRFSPRIDLTVLESIAARGVPLLLVGAHEAAFEPERWAALVVRPNVEWVGPQPFETVGAFMQRAAVGIVPYTDSEFNQASFPLKTLEYLAAGLPVVSTDLPFLDWLDSDFIARVRTPEAFADAVQAAMLLPADPASAAARQAFAATHSWDARAREWARILEL